MKTLVTTQFGFNVFISDDTDIIITDNKKEAMMFDERDNIEDKLAYYKAYTGYELKINQS